MRTSIHGGGRSPTPVDILARLSVVLAAALGFGVVAQLLVGAH